MRLHCTSHTIQRQKTCVADEAEKPQTLRLCDCRPFLDAKNATQWSWLTFVGGSSDEARHSRGCQVYIYCSGPTHSITTKHQFNYRVLPASQYQFTKDTDYPFRSTPLIRMLFTRLLSIILRTAQWVFAAIVLGLSAYFVYQRSRYHVGPLGRLIFAIIWSSLSILFAVIWAIPTSSSITGYTSDFIFTAGWAAVFGLLVSWFNDRGCGSAWAWSGVSFSRNNSCGQWRAAQAFSFLSMILWLATAILGILTVHRLRGRAAGRGSRV